MTAQKMLNTLTINSFSSTYSLFPPAKTKLPRKYIVNVQGVLRNMTDGEYLKCHLP